METAIILMHTLEKRLGSYHSHLEYRIKNIDNTHKEDDYHLEIHFEEETSISRFMDVINSLKRNTKEALNASIHWEQRMIEVEAYIYNEEEVAEGLRADLGKLEISGEVTEYGKDPDEKEDSDDDES